MIVTNWEQPPMSSTGEWINSVNIHTKEHHWLTEKNALLVSETWINLQIIMLHESKQKKRVLLHIVWFHSYKILKNVN